MGFAYDAPSTRLLVHTSTGKLKTAQQDKVRRIVVEGGYGMPSVCEIEADKDFAYGDIGEALDIYAHAPSSWLGDIVFRGTVQSREIRMDAAYGVRLVLRLYDASFMMSARRSSHVFKENMTYGEVVKQVARKSGLAPLVGGKILTDGPKRKMIIQANETDWEFIRRLARESGLVTYMRLYTLLGKPLTDLYFGVPTMAKRSSVPSGLKFELGDLRVLSMRGFVSAVGRPSSVAAIGWDGLKGQPASGQMTLGKKTRRSFEGRAEYRSDGAGTYATLERFSETKAEAVEYAKSLAIHHASAMQDLELVVRGNPLVKTNAVIYLDCGPYAAPNGAHSVSSFTHVYDPSLDGFTTTIYCSGIEDRSLGGLNGNGEPAGRFHGVYPAIVSSVEDPEQKGRVSLTLPWLGKNFVTNWARVVQLGAGKGTGLQLLPRPKDEVLVAFENGQLDFPYVLGGLYGKNQGKIGNDEMIDKNKKAPKKTALTTKTGHQILLDDDPETSSITIQTKNGQSCSIVLNDKSGITITTKGDGKNIVINSKSDLQLTATKKVTITGQDLTVDSKGPVKVKSSASVDVQGTSVNVNAKGALNLKGTSVTLQGSTGVNIKGAVVNLN